MGRRLARICAPRGTRTYVHAALSLGVALVLAALAFRGAAVAGPLLVALCAFIDNYAPCLQHGRPRGHGAAAVPEHNSELHPVHNILV